MVTNSERNPRFRCSRENTLDQFPNLLFKIEVKNHCRYLTCLPPAGNFPQCIKTIVVFGIWRTLFSLSHNVWLCSQCVKGLPKDIATNKREVCAGRNRWTSQSPEIQPEECLILQNVRFKLFWPGRHMTLDVDRELVRNWKCSFHTYHDSCPLQQTGEDNGDFELELQENCFNNFADRSLVFDLCCRLTAGMCCLPKNVFFGLGVTSNCSNGCRRVFYIIWSFNTD